MARFNTKTTPVQPTETNLAGCEAYTQSAKHELTGIMLTSMLQGQFYRDATATTKRMKELMQTVDPKFVAKLAIFARKEYGLRSISHVAAGELCHRVKGERYMTTFLEKLVTRPDDITEIIAYYEANYGDKHPNNMKRGLGKSFKKFKDYNLAKYRGEGKSVNMIDAIRICHPVNTTALLKKFNSGEMKNTQTWEAKLSDAGQKGETEEQVEELKSAAWKELLSEGKLGYLALIRNLRNILETNDAEIIKLAAKALKDDEHIAKAKIFPFQLYTAYRAIPASANYSRHPLREALGYAMDKACGNVPELPGKTCIAVDLSGSMTAAPRDENTKRLGNSAAEVARPLAAALYRKNNSGIVLFGSSAKSVDWDNNESMMTIIDKLEKSGDLGGTDFNVVFEVLQKLKERVDRIIYLTDGQHWMGGTTANSGLQKYKRAMKADPHIYIMDLCGYGTLQFPEHKVCYVPGFSEKVFDTMSLLETDKDALIKKIESIEL